MKTLAVGTAVLAGPTTPASVEVFADPQWNTMERRGTPYRWTASQRRTRCPSYPPAAESSRS